MQWKKPFIFKFERNSMKTEETISSKLCNGGKIIAEQILASNDRNKSEKSGLQESQSAIQLGN